MQAPVAIYVEYMLGDPSSLIFEAIKNDFSVDISALFATSGTTHVKDENNGDVAVDGANPTAGAHKSAFTLTAEYLSAATDGVIYLEIFESLDNPGPVNIGIFDEFSFAASDNAVIEKVVVYPAKTAAELQALTT
jgi:hypothetical protein